MANAHIDQYATSLKVEGWIPDKVIEFVSLTEMSTEDLSGGKARLVCKADNVTAICKPVV
jgi:hypothetical protein